MLFYRNNLTAMIGKYQHSSPLNKTFQLLVGLFLAILLLTSLTLIFTDGDLNSIRTIKQAQLIQSLCLFIALPLLLAAHWSTQPLAYLNLKKNSTPSSYLLVIGTMLAAIPVINFIASINQQISFPESLSWIENWMRTTENKLQALTIRLVNVSTISDLVFNILLIAVLAGLGEELMFRGVVFKLLSEWKNSIFAIWVAAFIFSSIHLQFYGFFPRFLLGALFGYMLVWSGNLWLPILAHTINNGVAVVFYYLKFNGISVIDIDTIGTGDTVYLAVLSAAFTALFIVPLRKQLIKNNKVVV